MISFRRFLGLLLRPLKGFGGSGRCSGLVLLEELSVEVGILDGFRPDFGGRRDFGLGLGLLGGRSIEGLGDREEGNRTGIRDLDAGGTFSITVTGRLVSATLLFATSFLVNFLGSSRIPM